jgi:hypothetical protein
VALESDVDCGAEKAVVVGKGEDWLNARYEYKKDMSLR